MTRDRAGAAVVYAVAILAAVVALYRVRTFYEDDAYITLRYAQRWIAGRGPTWTDGERVEGYTHPLWLLQIALLGRLGVDLVSASRALGVAYFAGIFLVFWRGRATAGSALVLATLPGLSLWALGGLETVSFAFWIVVGVWLVSRAVEPGNDARAGVSALAGASLAAAGLTRPEGIGVGLVALVWVASARRWSALRVMAAVFGAPLAAWELFRVAYYGDALANSARAKIFGLPLRDQIAGGLEYLVASSPLWGFAALAVLAVLALTRRPDALWMLAATLPVVAGLLLGGGDHMAGARLLVPVIVLGVFAAGVSVSSRRTWLAPALLGVAALLQARRALLHDWKPDPAARWGRVVGALLEKELPKGTLVATATAGSEAFFAPSLRFIDMLGLNDRHIARRDVPARLAVWQGLPGHQKGDGEYVLSRAPEVVVLGEAAGYLGRDPRRWFLSDYELLALPEFRARYRPYRFELETGYLTLYVREGSAAVQDLAAAGQAVRAPWEADPPTRPVRLSPCFSHGIRYPVD